MVSLISDCSEVNYFETFWISYDILNHLRDNVVRWGNISVDREGPIRIYNEATTLYAEREVNSTEGILASYYCEMTSFLVGQSSGIEASPRGS